MLNILKRKKKYIYRDAKDGRFVGRLYALLHPTTTVREEIKDA